MADYFARPIGTVWETSVALATGQAAKHIQRTQLLQNLKGFGKGKAKWDDAWEVAQAANYVEQWSEHLLDWSKAQRTTIAAAVGRTFRKRS